MMQGITRTIGAADQVLSEGMLRDGQSFSDAVGDKAVGGLTMFEQPFINIYKKLNGQVKDADGNITPLNWQDFYGAALSALGTREMAKASMTDVNMPKETVAALKDFTNNILKGRNGRAFELGNNFDKPIFEVGDIKPNPVEPKGSIYGQSETYTCVASSLKMALQDLGIVLSESEIATALKTDTNGARVVDIPQAIENLGLKNGVEKITSIEQLESLLKNGNSAIGSVTVPGKGAHAVVIDGIKNGEIIIRDPLPMGTGSSYSIPYPEFKNFYNNRAVIINK